MIGPVALVTVVAILTPALAVLLGPPVPMSVIVPLVVVLNVPAVNEIPWQAPVVPRLLAVICRAVAEVEEVEKSPAEAKPIPAAPTPTIELVAMRSPAVVKSPLTPTLIPLPPVAPPLQEEKVKSPVVKEVHVPLIDTP